MRFSTVIDLLFIQSIGTMKTIFSDTFKPFPKLLFIKFPVEFLFQR
jgi:hypothetical protein